MIIWITDALRAKVVRNNAINKIIIKINPINEFLILYYLIFLYHIKIIKNIIYDEIYNTYSKS